MTRAHTGDIRGVRGDRATSGRGHPRGPWRPRTGRRRRGRHDALRLSFSQPGHLLTSYKCAMRPIRPLRHPNFRYGRTGSVTSAPALHCDGSPSMDSYNLIAIAARGCPECPVLCSVWLGPECPRRGPAWPARPPGVPSLIYDPRDEGRWWQRSSLPAALAGVLPGCLWHNRRMTGHTTQPRSAEGVVAWLRGTSRARDQKA